LTVEKSLGISLFILTLAKTSFDEELRGLGLEPSNAAEHLLITYSDHQFKINREDKHKMEIYTLLLLDLSDAGSIVKDFSS
jgi:hypothetical protein